MKNSLKRNVSVFIPPLVAKAFSGFLNVAVSAQVIHTFGLGEGAFLLILLTYANVASTISRLGADTLVFKYWNSSSIDYSDREQRYLLLNRIGCFIGNTHKPVMVYISLIGSLIAIVSIIFNEDVSNVAIYENYISFLFFTLSLPFISKNIMFGLFLQAAQKPACSVVLSQILPLLIFNIFIFYLGTFDHLIVNISVAFFIAYYFSQKMIALVFIPKLAAEESGPRHKQLLLDTDKLFKASSYFFDTNRSVLFGSIWQLLFLWMPQIFLYLVGESELSSAVNLAIKCSLIVNMIFITVNSIILPRLAANLEDRSPLKALIDVLPIYLMFALTLLAFFLGSYSMIMLGELFDRIPGLSEATVAIIFSIVIAQIISFSIGPVTNVYVYAGYVRWFSVLNFVGLVNLTILLAVPTYFNLMNIFGIFIGVGIVTHKLLFFIPLISKRLQHDY